MPSLLDIFRSDSELYLLWNSPRTEAQLAPEKDKSNKNISGKVNGHPVDIAIRQYTLQEGKIIKVISGTYGEQNVRMSIREHQGNGLQLDGKIGENEIHLPLTPNETTGEIYGLYDKQKMTVQVDKIGVSDFILKVVISNGLSDKPSLDVLIAKEE